MKAERIPSHEVADLMRLADMVGTGLPDSTERFIAAASRFSALARSYGDLLNERDDAVERADRVEGGDTLSMRRAIRDAIADLECAL